jgi:hypothetical protein
MGRHPDANGQVPVVLARQKPRRQRQNIDERN